MTGGQEGQIIEPTRETKVQVCRAYLPKIGNYHTIS